MFLEVGEVLLKRLSSPKIVGTSQISHSALWQRCKVNPFGCLTSLSWWWWIDMVVAIGVADCLLFWTNPPQRRWKIEPFLVFFGRSSIFGMFAVTAHTSAGQAEHWWDPIQSHFHTGFFYWHPPEKYKKINQNYYQTSSSKNQHHQVTIAVPDVGDDANGQPHHHLVGEKPRYDDHHHAFLLFSHL